MFYLMLLNKWTRKKTNAFIPCISKSKQSSKFSEIVRHGMWTELRNTKVFIYDTGECWRSEIIDHTHT
jgi:hypothetical protein